MEYDLAIENAPASVPAGTAILLLHPSTGETDRIDTDFLRTDTDRFLVVSTRTTAREVEQKLEHYDVDAEKAEILDTLSVERGYSRRSGEGLHYVSAPDDLKGITEQVRRFLDENDGKLRVSVDSVTELAYYADDGAAVREAVADVVQLLEEFDAVGLFHLSSEVHDEAELDRYRSLFDATVTLAEDGTVYTDF